MICGCCERGSNGVLGELHLWSISKWVSRALDWRKGHNRKRRADLIIEHSNFKQKIFGHHS